MHAHFACTSHRKIFGGDVSQVTLVFFSFFLNYHYPPLNYNLISKKYYNFYWKKYPFIVLFSPIVGSKNFEIFPKKNLVPIFLNFRKIKILDPKNDIFFFYLQKIPKL